MATIEDRDRLARLMISIIPKLRHAKPMYGFLPLEGAKYQRGNGLMIVGRAIADGGWGDKPLSENQQDANGIRQYVSDLYNWGNGDGDEMAWVNEQWGCTDWYNTRRSAFWRVIKKVTMAVDASATEEYWASHLVWSDLYKISAHGNPDGQLESLQRAGCVEMLKAEFDEYLPSKVLFLTGWSWAEPFLDSEDVTRSSVDMKFAEASQRLTLHNGQGCSLVVAKHPERKPEEPWVEEVLQSFEAQG